MKRITAAKRIKAHLGDYRERLQKDASFSLGYYATDTGSCPLCCAVVDCCDNCVLWPSRARAAPLAGCSDFVNQVDSLKTAKAKFGWIDKLEAELDRWASEEKS